MKIANNKLLNICFINRLGFLFIWMPLYIIVNLLALPEMLIEAMLISLMIFTLFSTRLILIDFNKVLLWIYLLILAVPYIMFFIDLSSNYEIPKNSIISKSIDTAFLSVIGTYVMLVSLYSVMKKHSKVSK